MIFLFFRSLTTLWQLFVLADKPAFAICSFVAFKKRSNKRSFFEQYGCLNVDTDVDLRIKDIAWRTWRNLQESIVNSGRDCLQYLEKQKNVECFFRSSKGRRNSLSGFKKNGHWKIVKEKDGSSILLTVHPLHDGFTDEPTKWRPYVFCSTMPFIVAFSRQPSQSCYDENHRPFIKEKTKIVVIFPRIMTVFISQQSAHPISIILLQMILENERRSQKQV